MEALRVEVSGLRVWSGQPSSTLNPQIGDHLLPGGRRLSGAAQLKKRVLSMLGYHVVSLPHWEWEHVAGNDDATDAYLRVALGLRV